MQNKIAAGRAAKSKPIVAIKKLKEEDQTKLKAVEWDKIDTTKGGKSMTTGRPKLKQMLDSFKFHASAGVENGADKINDFIDLCEKKAIESLSIVERNEGALSRGMSDLQIFKKIVDNTRKGLNSNNSIDFLEGLPEEVKKPKFTMRRMLESAKTAFFSFGKVSSSSKSRKREVGKS